MATRYTRRQRSSTRLVCDALEPRETPAGIRVIDFENGFTPGRMTGINLRYEDGALVLMDNPFQTDAALAQTRVDVRAFHTSFVFQQGEDNPASNWAKGDGFTFFLESGSYPLSNPLTGVAGEGLGYQGITQSVAVKFDLVDNAGEGTDSVGVFIGGAAPTTPAVNLKGTGIDLHSGHPFRADIAYADSNLTLTLTDTTAPEHNWMGSFAVDIPGALESKTGYVGFTAGTGELFTRQTIQSWTFAEDTPPAPMNQPPEIVAPIGVTWFVPSSVDLHATATDDGGAAGLTYAWEVVSAPAGTASHITVHNPGNAFASVGGAGRYVFRVTVTDAEGLVATRTVNFDFQPPFGFHSTLLSLPVVGTNVFPQDSTVRAGETLQFTLDLRDPLGKRMPDPGPTWQVSSGPGTIDSTGLYTAPADASGLVTIRAAIPDPQLPPAQWRAFASKLFIIRARESTGDVNFSSGFAGSDLIRNGPAREDGDAMLLADAPYQAGSVYAPSPVDVRGFTTSFRFRVGDMPSWYFGDGLTFVFQNAGPTAVGVAGGGLGYEGIGQSVAVKFDLVDNAGEGTDSVGVFTGGAAPTVPADTFVPDPSNSGLKFNNGQVFQADLSYSGGILLLNVRDTVSGQQFTKTYKVNIPAAVGGPTAYVGFTAGTGELFAPIDILDWTYTPTTDASGNAAPLILPGLTPEFRFVYGTTTYFVMLAADDGRIDQPWYNIDQLWYNWEVVSAPAGAAPVRFETISWMNGGPPTSDGPWSTRATFDRAGEYTFQLTVADHSQDFIDHWIPDANATRSGPIVVDVEQVPSEFVVTPSAATVMKGGTVALDVDALDQFGDPIVGFRDPTTGTLGGWSLVLDGPGSIDSEYRYHAPQSWTGPVTIRATNGTVTGVTVINVVEFPSTTLADYSGGFEASPRLAFSGSAVRNLGRAQLTLDAPNLAGSVFHATPLAVTGFVSRSQFRLGGPVHGAGIAFVVQGTGPTAVGAAGSGLGYEGIDKSVAVTFDPAANAIGLATNGAAPTATVNLAGTGIDLQSGDTLEADLYYDGSTLSVALTDVNTGVTTNTPFAVDIPGLVGGPAAFVGFTGATGSIVDPSDGQNILDWRYLSVQPGTPNEPPKIFRPACLVSFVNDTSHAFFQTPIADDGGPFNLRARWELVTAPEGPAPEFDPSGRDAIWFQNVGTYTFRVTVTDAQGQSAVGYTTYTVDSLL
jgi:Legume lectin domain/Bacterial lectin